MFMYHTVFTKNTIILHGTLTLRHPHYDIPFCTFTKTDNA